MNELNSGPHNSRPLLLDLFCGAGGAAMGYHRAGFDVIGVDIAPQPRYPFDFVQADALEHVDGVMKDFGSLHVAAVHASPPCQGYSKALRHMSDPTPFLIDPVRDRLDAIGLPYVIENVPGAPLATQPDLFGRDGIQICGTGLGLRVWRHRLFESNVPLVGVPCAHKEPSFNHYNKQGRERIYAEFGKQDPDPLWAKEMGVPWMGKYEAREAIPPAYTEHIGKQLLAYIEVAA